MLAPCAAQVQQPASAAMPASASEPSNSPIHRAGAAEQQHSFDDLCLQPPFSPAVRAANVQLPQPGQFARPASRHSVPVQQPGAVNGCIKRESSADAHEDALGQTPQHHDQGHIGAALCDAAPKDVRPQPLLTLHSEEFDEIDLPPRSASATGDLRHASQRSLDDLDMLLKTQDDEIPPWPLHSASPPHSARQASVSGALPDTLPVAAAAAAVAAQQQSMHEQHAFRHALPVPARMVPASPQHAPSCVADADSDVDGCDDYSQRHGGSSPPLSTGALHSQPWMGRRSMDTAATQRAATFTDGGEGMAHNHALRQLQCGGGHGPVFCSGRSIAAEWLQVPAVPLAPGAACHDDASVPEAAAWARRSAQARRRARGGRSRSVVSRNVSRTSLLLSPDVQKLGVASSLASEGSEWPVHQREYSVGAGAHGAPVLLAGSSGRAGGDGGVALRQGSATQRVTEKPVPEGHELLWDGQMQ